MELRFGWLGRTRSLEGKRKSQIYVANISGIWNAVKSLVFPPPNSLHEHGFGVSKSCTEHKIYEQSDNSLWRFVPTRGGFVQHLHVILCSGSNHQPVAIPPPPPSVLVVLLTAYCVTQAHNHKIRKLEVKPASG